MGDLHRIHPFPDLESAAAGSPVPHPTVPLLPSSEKGDPATAQTPPPPPRRIFRRLLLCLCTSLILLVGLLATTFYLFFHPKLPQYSITGLHVTNNHTLSTAFAVNVTARNPNNRIGIYYDHGSQLSVLYENSELFQGYLPVFYQGHRNTTVIAVALSGTTTNSAIARDGGVALVIKGKVRVRVKLGKLKITKRMVIKVRCEVIVDRLNSIDGKINIKSSSCKTHL